MKADPAIVNEYSKTCVQTDNNKGLLKYIISSLPELARSLIKPCFPLNVLKLVGSTIVYCRQCKNHSSEPTSISHNFSTRKHHLVELCPSRKLSPDALLTNFYWTIKWSLHRNTIILARWNKSLLYYLSPWLHSAWPCFRRWLRLAQEQQTNWATSLARNLCGVTPFRTQWRNLKEGFDLLRPYGMFLFLWSMKKMSRTTSVLPHVDITDSS